jgi:hypothetical protein
MNKPAIPQAVNALVLKGVHVINPESIHLDESVDLDRIDSTASIYPGCRISGNTTYIGPSCHIGQDGPVTIDDCQLGSDVHLMSGTFRGATFLDNSSCGPNAQIRPQTLMEEHASCAHSVGLKQTILMPYVTLGSLINFCDCFMSGGTSRKNHSEVGSSYIHFNFTANQDKATPSLIGDVPRGVMLDQPPIFLGGQGGLVGPAQIEYGTVIAAGTICRRDVTEQGKLVLGNSPREDKEINFKPGTYTDFKRTLTNNVIYIGNLHALHQWYTQVRAKHMAQTAHGNACYEAALGRIEQGIIERCDRLSQLASIIEECSTETGSELASQCRDRLGHLQEHPSPSGDDNQKKAFLTAWEKQEAGLSYIESIQTLSTEARLAGTTWLQSIVETVAQHS